MDKKNYQTDNKSFMIYKDWRDIVCILSDEQAGVLFKALFEFSVGKDTQVTDPLIKMAYTMMTAAIERDGLKWEEICMKNAQNAKKGGRPKKPSGFSENRTVANKTHIDKDKEKDKDTEKDREKDTDKETDNVSKSVNANANDPVNKSVSKSVNHNDYSFMREYEGLSRLF